VIEVFDRLMKFDPDNVEFRYLRDSLAGEHVARPPDQYIALFFDRFAPRFEARLVGELGYCAPEFAARVLAPTLQGRSGLRAVDLGCGTGLSGGLLRPHASALAGVDLSGAMLEQARARNLYDEIAQEEIGAWLGRQPAGCVDLALALDVFIYVGDLDRVMDAASAALAPGGLLAFSIELLDEGGGDFTLLAAGRYAHAAAYVEKVAGDRGLRVRLAERFDIRHEAGKPVAAILYLLEKP
jgi:predicted TPR repeat methyltransferase